MNVVKISVPCARKFHLKGLPVYIQNPHNWVIMASFDSSPGDLSEDGIQYIFGTHVVFLTKLEKFLYD